MATRTRVRKYGRNQVSWGTCISREAVKRLVASVTTKEKDKMKQMLLSLPLNTLPSILLYGNWRCDNTQNQRQLCSPFPELSSCPSMKQLEESCCLGWNSEWWPAHLRSIFRGPDPTDDTRSSQGTSQKENSWRLAWGLTPGPKPIYSTLWRSRIYPASKVRPATCLEPQWMQAGSLLILKSYPASSDPVVKQEDKNSLKHSDKL